MKFWLKKNGVNTLFIAICILLVVSTDAKAWVMKQIVSTGLLNSNIEKSGNNSASKNIPDTSINFSVKNTSGKSMNTKDLKGKVVFINFWASWCPPCRAEFPSIQEFYQKYKDNPKVEFLIVSLDQDKSAGKRFLEKQNYTVPFLTPNGNIPQEIFNGSLPTTVILDKNGNIRLQHKGMADYSTTTFYEQFDTLINE